jgi:hypothetical protein
MSKNKKSKDKGMLIPLITGLLSFFVSGVIACVVIGLTDNYIFAAGITGGLGSLLLALLIRSIRTRLIRTTIAGALTMPLSLAVGFFLVEGVGALMPQVGYKIESIGLADVIAVILIAAIFGTIMGIIIYGIYSVRIFLPVCAVAGIPAGVLVNALNGPWRGTAAYTAIMDTFRQMDLNFLSMAVFMGIGMGASVGIYKKMAL